MSNYSAVIWNNDDFTHEQAQEAMKKRVSWTGHELIFPADTDGTDVFRKFRASLVKLKNCLKPGDMLLMQNVKPHSKIVMNEEVDGMATAAAKEGVVQKLSSYWHLQNRSPFRLGEYAVSKKLNISFPQNPKSSRSFVFVSV